MMDDDFPTSFAVGGVVKDVGLIVDAAAASGLDTSFLDSVLDVFRRAEDAGVLRPGLVFNDIAMILEQATAIRVADPERTVVLRRRYLALQLEAMRARRPRGGPPPLPGPPPTDAELGERWVPRK